MLCRGRSLDHNMVANFYSYLANVHTHCVCIRSRNSAQDKNDEHNARAQLHIVNQHNCINTCSMLLGGC